LIRIEKTRIFGTLAQNTSDKKRMSACEKRIQHILMLKCRFVFMPDENGENTKITSWLCQEQHTRNQGSQSLHSENQYGCDDPHTPNQCWTDGINPKTDCAKTIQTKMAS